MRCLVFDIETVPDTELGARLYGLAGLDDEDVAKALSFKRLQDTGSDFLPLHQHRVVAIAVALRSSDEFRLWSLGDEGSGEAELIRRFYDGIERFSPTLVSWNGSGFDLPVLHYRALRHRIRAPRYWEVGDEDTAFRYNNYLNRFHWRHTDLMDVLSGFQARAAVKLQEVALMLGLPGKLGLRGEEVWEAFRRGELGAIRRYCEVDVLNTYLIYLNFQHMRGELGTEELTEEFQRVRAFLKATPGEHWQAFAEGWPESSEA